MYQEAAFGFSTTEGQGVTVVVTVDIADDDQVFEYLFKATTRTGFTLVCDQQAYVADVGSLIKHLRLF